MANDSDRSHRELAHFHACVHCGSTFRRDAFDSTSVTTGIYPCSKCGLDGQLNVVIQDVVTVSTGTDHSAPDSSAG